MVLLLPFDLPDAFVIGRLQRQVLDDIAGVAVAVGKPVRALHVDGPPSSSALEPSEQSTAGSR
jgi:hypothetical protein